jgi:hypothetical protein
MLNVILGLLMVSLVSASGFMLINNMSLTAAVSDMHENARRLDIAADAVTARLGVPAGQNQGMLFAPAPADGTTDVLPSTVAGVHATVGGIPFRYCAYAPAAGGFAVSGGYVVSAPAPKDDQVAQFRPAAIVIAAGLHASQAPSCDSVHVVNGRLAVDGGLVRMVSFVKGVTDAQLTDGSSFEMWVSPGANDTGSDAAHPASLAKAMDVWKGKLPKSMVIHVPGGAVFADPDLGGAFSMPSQPAGTIRSSKLSIVADGAGGTIISANATFDPQGALALVGVSMPQTVIHLGSHNAASIQGGQVAGVDVEAGSSIAFNGAVTVQGGGVVVAGDATVQNGLAVIGSSSSDLIQVPAGGRLILSGATLSLKNGQSGIALAGDLAGSGTIVGAGVREEIRLVDGGRMALDGSVGGAASGYAVLGDGMPASLGGALTVASGGSGCWAGDVFAFSTTASSRTVVPEQVAPPAPGPDGKVDAAATNQFIQNSDARSRATALLGINRSNWGCGA